MRIDANLQRNLPTGISPSPPAQDLSFSSGDAGAEEWTEELLSARLHFLHIWQHWTSSPLINTDGMESQRDFFSPAPLKIINFSCLVLAECFSSRSVFGTAWELSTTYDTSYKNNYWPACWDTWWRTCLLLFFFFGGIYHRQRVLIMK